MSIFGGGLSQESSEMTAGSSRSQAAAASHHHLLSIEDRVLESSDSSYLPAPTLHSRFRGGKIPEICHLRLCLFDACARSRRAEDLEEGVSRCDDGPLEEGDDYGLEDYSFRRRRRRAFRRKRRKK